MIRTSFRRIVVSGIFSLACLSSIATAQYPAVCKGDGSGTPCPCSNNGMLGNGCANATFPGTGANLSGSGTASFSADTLVLTGVGMPNTMAAFYESSTLLGSGSGIVYGSGLQCVPLTFMLGVKPIVGGSASYPSGSSPTISVRSATIGDPLAVGATRFYQIIYIDLPSTCIGQTRNTTNAISAIWFP